MSRTRTRGLRSGNRLRHRARSSPALVLARAKRARPSYYMVPTIIRWPKGLLEAINVELERRKKKVPHSRASTIRELVAERLKVSASDGAPLPVLRLGENGAKK